MRYRWPASLLKNALLCPSIDKVFLNERHLLLLHNLIQRLKAYRWAKPSWTFTPFSLLCFLITPDHVPDLPLIVQISSFKDLELLQIQSVKAQVDASKLRSVIWPDILPVEPLDRLAFYVVERVCGDRSRAVRLSTFEPRNIQRTDRLQRTNEIIFTGWMLLRIHYSYWF